MHLHPKYQSDLAELFVYAVKNGRKLIVETHSEHIINRTRLLIKQSPNEEHIEDKANIYFFNKEDNIVKYEEIKIHNDGRISHWPEYFFDQNYTDSLGAQIN